MKDNSPNILFNNTEVIECKFIKSLLQLNGKKRLTVSDGTATLQLNSEYTQNEATSKTRGSPLLLRALQISQLSGHKFREPGAISATAAAEIGLA